MANVKKIWNFLEDTGMDIIAVVMQLFGTEKVLDDVDGSFQSTPVTPYVTLAEHSTYKKYYVKNEDRTTWVDGSYLILFYDKLGGAFNTATNDGKGSVIYTVQDDKILTLADIYDQVILAGQGERQITVQLYLTATTTPIAGVSVQVLNEAQTLLVAQGVTNVSGQVIFALDDGIDKVRLAKTGYSFTVPETMTITEDATKTYYGTVLSIGTPISVNSCRVYEYCFEADDITPLASVDVEATIISLPYNYNGKLHAGSVIDYVYNDTTGLLYWDIVYGATVRFKLIDLYKETLVKVIPAQTTIRLSSMT